MQLFLPLLATIALAASSSIVQGQRGISTKYFGKKPTDSDLAAVYPTMNVLSISVQGINERVIGVSLTYQTLEGGVSSLRHGFVDSKAQSMNIGTGEHIMSIFGVGDGDGITYLGFATTKGQVISAGKKPPAMTPEMYDNRTATYQVGGFAFAVESNILKGAGAYWACIDANDCS